MFLEPDATDLEDCRNVTSREHASARVVDFGRTLHHLLSGSDSDQFFRHLEKLTIRFPVKYYHASDQNSSASTIYDGINIFQQYRYSSTMYFKRYLTLISAWISPGYDVRSIQPDFHNSPSPSPVTMELINLSPHQFPAMDFNGVNFIPVKNLRIGLRPGQIYQEGVKMQTPSQIKRYWSDFQQHLARVLEYSFPKIETVHISGWWEQNRYYYLARISDMSTPIEWLEGHVSCRLRYTTLTLENLVLFKPKLHQICHLAKRKEARMIKLKNCILATDKDYFSDSTEEDPWKDFFAHSPEVMDAPGYWPGKDLKFCIESADGEEGHPSAFRYARYKMGEEGAIMFGVAPLSTPWKEAVVQCEDGAAEAYWELQSRYK